jgi:DNA-binding response OmpR family regulator
MVVTAVHIIALRLTVLPHISPRYTIHLSRNGSAQINMANRNGKRKRILLVGDREGGWELVVLKLREYEFSFARDFDQGLRLAWREDFDLYILDNELPDRYGVELCRVIRSFDPHTPILFCSAVAHERNIREALRSGAQAYLVKPVSLDDLEQAVARLTGSA